jgi:hypothetical protein
MMCIQILLLFAIIVGVSNLFDSATNNGDKEIPCSRQKGCVIYCVTSFPKFCTVKEYRGCEVKLCMSKVLALDGRE